MIYIEQDVVDSKPTIFFVEDGLQNFMIMNREYNGGCGEGCEFQLYDDYNQTKLAPSILDRW